MNTATLDRPRSPAVNPAAIVGTFENLFRLVATDTTELFLVRHAEPDYERAASGQSPLDPVLTERGRNQAMRLARRLRDTEIAAIYTSPARRAVETAAILSAVKRAPMICNPELREIAMSPAVLNNGAEDDPQKLASEVVSRFLNHPRWDAIEGMEPSKQFRRRVLHAVDGIVNRHPGQLIVVVTHAGVINAALSTVLDIQRDMFFLPEHASITSMRVLRDLHAVQCLNDFSHLLPTFSPR